MKSFRNIVLTFICALATATALMHAQPLKAESVDDTIEVTIKLQDESGKPIPYVSVWYTVECDPRHVRDFAIYQSLNLADLWRFTQRYGALHDIISEYGDKPAKGLGIRIMGNAVGVFRDTLSYQVETGKGNHYPRPDPLTFGYTFMKHGYFPGKGDFAVPKNQNRVEAVVTLKRNPKEVLETQPHLQKFAEVRYQLSDTAKNTAMTPENDQRMKQLKYELEQAAQQAISAGDKPAAARIYARMRYMPSLIYLEGRIAGFSQGDGTSAEAKRALDMAYQLDPDNLYVQMNTYGRRAVYPPNASREDRIRVNVALIERLIAVHGEKAWPRFYNLRAASYAELGEYAKARQLYLEAAKLEPKYIDWSNEIDNMKAQMRRKGVSIPANW